MAGTASKNSSDDENDLYQLLFEAPALLFKASAWSTLLFSLFNNDTKQFMSEEYQCTISQNNFPRNGSPDDTKVLFKNITKKEFLSDIYIVCKIYVKTNNLEYIPQNEIYSKKNIKSKKQISNKWPAIPDNELHIPFGCSVISLAPIKKALENDKIKSDKCHSYQEEHGSAPIWIYEHTTEKQVASMKKDSKNECDILINSFHNMHLDVINRNIKKSNIVKAPLSVGIVHSLCIFYGNIDEVEQIILNHGEITNNYFDDKKLNQLTFAERIDTANINSNININHVTVGEINDYHVKNYRYGYITNEKNNIGNKTWISRVFGGKEQLFRLLISGYFRKMTEDNDNYHKFRDLISIVLKYGYIKAKNHPDRVYYRHLLYFTVNKISKMNLKQETGGINVMTNTLVKRRNICVVVELRDNKRLRVKKPMFIMGKNCIDHNNRALLTTEIQLPVMVNNSEPIWNQLYCLVLDYDVDFLKKLHFYFEFYNLSNKKANFEGFTFLKLSQNAKKKNNVKTFIDSDVYKLQIYPHDDKKMNHKGKSKRKRFNYLSQSVEKAENKAGKKKKIAPLTDHCLEIELNWKSDVLFKN